LAEKYDLQVTTAALLLGEGIPYLREQSATHHYPTYLVPSTPRSNSGHSNGVIFWGKGKPEITMHALNAVGNI
jgi:hypothetical protein